jgi:hypothetical protein
LRNLLVIVVQKRIIAVDFLEKLGVMQQSVVYVLITEYFDETYFHLLSYQVPVER